MFERHLAIPVASYLACTRITPLQVSAAKIALALLAAYVVAKPGYVVGLIAAVVYLVSRVLDAVAGDLAAAELGHAALIASDLVRFLPAALVRTLQG